MIAMPPVRVSPGEKGAGGAESAAAGNYRGSDGASSDGLAAASASTTEAVLATAAGRGLFPAAPLVGCGFNSGNGSGSANGPGQGLLAHPVLDALQPQQHQRRPCNGRSSDPLNASQPQYHENVPSIKTPLTSDIEAAEILVRMLQETIRALTQVENK